MKILNPLTKFTALSLARLFRSNNLLGFLSNSEFGTTLVSKCVVPLVERLAKNSIPEAFDGSYNPCNSVPGTIRGFINYSSLARENYLYNKRRRRGFATLASSTQEETPEHPETAPTIPDEETTQPDSNLEKATGSRAAIRHLVR